MCALKKILHQHVLYIVSHACMCLFLWMRCYTKPPQPCVFWKQTWEQHSHSSLTGKHTGVCEFVCFFRSDVGNKIRKGKIWLQKQDSGRVIYIFVNVQTQYCTGSMQRCLCDHHLYLWAHYRVCFSYQISFHERFNTSYATLCALGYLQTEESHRQNVYIVTAEL